MISKRALTIACYGAIASSVAVIMSPVSFQYALPWNHPKDSPRLTPSAAQDLPRLAQTELANSDSEKPMRLVSLWKSGDSGGATILDGKGAAHTLKLGQEVAGYQLTKTGEGKAIFSSSKGDLTLSLTPMPVAPNLAAIGVKSASSE